MKNSFGQSISVTIIGESHGPEIGAIIDGLAPGMPISDEYILELERVYCSWSMISIRGFKR